MKTILLFGLLLACTCTLSAQIKKPEPVPVKVSFAESLQAVIVRTKDWAATSGTARLYERKSPTAKWEPIDRSFPVVVGRSGVAGGSIFSDSDTVAFKREGDGKSPAGRFPLTLVFGTAVKPEKLTFPYIRVDSQTECVDDVNSTHYNKIVGRHQVGNFDWKSSEKMLEIGPPYELGVFVAYNSYPVVRGNGSCIFLHIWKDASTPTAGCTAMERTNLERIVGWLDVAKNPYLVQLTEDQYKGLRKRWNLPK